MADPIKTWAQLAQEAYDVQNACNLSGVLHSAYRAVCNVRALLESEGKPWSTDTVNRHPISVLWADKIAHLAGTQSANDACVSAAYDWVHSMGVK